MGWKGVANARHYKTPRLHLGAKDKRIEEERKARSEKYKTLTPQEKLVYEILREYTIEQMTAVGRGLTINEADYARRIVKELNE